MKSQHTKLITVAIVLCGVVSCAGIADVLFENTNTIDAAARPRPNPPAADSAEIAASLPMFGRVNPSLVRGSQPNRGGVSVLRRLSVKSIVDLRSKYDHTDDVREVAERLGLNYYWVPMSVWDPPTDQETAQFLALVTDESKGPFFVFCGDGVNRTGEMCAIYRVIHDQWTVEAALNEMDAAGFNPYYYTLRQYVWTYARKFRPQAVPPEGRSLSSTEQ